MKKMIIIAVTLFTAMSCSTSEETDIDGITKVETEFYESSSLRATFREISAQQNSPGRNKNKELCFNFQYPIELGFNDGTTQTVSDFKQLLDLLLKETPETHVTSIGFPFNVVLDDGTVQTINDETEFETLIEDCGYDLVTVAEVYAVFDKCFTVNYPLTLIIDGVAETFNNQDEIENRFSSFSDHFAKVKFSYPVSISYVSDGSTDSIDDDYELVYLITETCEID